MTKSSFRERCEPLERTRAVDPVSYGSPAVVTLRAGPDLRDVLTISAMMALVKRHAPLASAKLAVEQALDMGRSVLSLPMLENAGALADDIAAAGMRIAVMRPEDDVRAVREGLSLTRGEFADRYGLDVEAVAAWEDGRDTPDTAARSYLKVIRRLPVAVSEALEKGTA